MSLSHLVDQIVRAAVIEDRSFDGLLPQLMEASRTASPTEMDAAMPRMADGIAEAPPNLGGWLAIVTGAWTENGADPAAAGQALVERITDERGVAAAGTGGRSIGVLPLMPVACAVAVVIALAPMTASGELRALAALGCSPWRARLAAVLTAIAIAVASAVSFAAGGADIAALFPPAVPAGDFRVEGPAFVSERRLLKVING